MNPEPKYRKVHIQDLEPRPQIETKPVTQKTIFKDMNFSHKWANSEPLFYQDTGIGKDRITSEQIYMKPQTFIQAFLHAYTQHGDVLLVPDDFWLLVLMFFAEYAEENSEKLRHRLVTHQQGKVTLVVHETVGSKEEAKKKYKEWDYFFQEIIKEIKAHTVEGVVEALACDFTTTTPIYKIASTSIIMNSLEEFFEYERHFAICGISNVYMAGQREDWLKLKAKVENLAQFDVDGKLNKYIENVRVIFSNLVDTWDEKPDVEWWGRIMKSPETKSVYGGKQVQIDGWILHLLGKYEKTDICSLPALKTLVPVKLVDDANQVTLDLALITDWVSISKVDERTYKPDIAVTIVDVNDCVESQYGEDDGEEQLEEAQQGQQVEQ